MKKTNAKSKTSKTLNLGDKEDANKFDKVIKEEIELVVPMLLKKVVGVEYQSLEKVRDDIQHTKERISDSLQLATTYSGERVILQNEFQTVDEPRMVNRMLGYCALVVDKFNLPVEQNVFYLSDDKPKMPTELVQKNLFFRFNLFCLNDYDYKLFLQSEKPGEKIFAVLGKYPKEETENVAKEIIEEVRKSSSTEFESRKHLNQLVILSGLRKLQPIIETIMANVSHFINLEENVLYLRGEEEGIIKGEQLGIVKGEQRGEIKGEQRGLMIKAKESVSNLLRDTDFSAEKIARIINVPVEFVLAVKKELGIQ